MSLISPLLKQSATLKRVVSTDMYGNPTTSDTSIMIRYEKIVKLFRLANEEEWRSEAHIMADVELCEGDKIVIGSDEKEIQAVSHIPGLGGGSTFWEGWL